jgi:predicted HAD superfamily Cof-like phosphohydrolase
MKKLTNFEKVKEFHEVFDPGNNITIPTFNTKEVRKLKLALIKEEFTELKDALKAKDIIEVADAIGDILYVTYGAALAFGIDADAVFDVIHKSNMTKAGEDGKPILNGINCALQVNKPYGKVVKGPNFIKPDLTKVIKNLEASGLTLKQTT